MAFNFMSFLGGAAEQLTDVIETREAERMYEERQVKAEQREERRFAKRQAAAAARDRKKAEDEVADLIETLSLIYPPEVANEIAQSKSKSRINFAINVGEDAMRKNIVPATLWNFATNEKGEVDESVITETLEVPMAKPAPAPDDLSETTSVPSSSLSLDVGAYSEMFVEPDDYEQTHNARISVLDQKMARSPNSPNYSEWERERADVLERLADFKANQKEMDGTTTPSFTVGTISSNMAMFDKTSLPAAGFKLGIDDQIENLEEGNMHMQDIARLDTVSKATEFNKAYDDPGMKAAINAYRNAAINNLKDYAYDTYYDTAVTTTTYTDPDQVDRDIRTGKLRRGTVYMFDGSVYVYTGIEDIVTGNAFYEFSLE